MRLRRTIRCEWPADLPDYVMAAKRRKKRHGGKKNKRMPAQQRIRPAGSSAHSDDELAGREAWYLETWKGSRSGARASRGFHFQDVVGAWFGSQVASGRLEVDGLVPEGLDDFQFEGLDPAQVEVKSRQGRLGPFPVGAAAELIVVAWSRHADRFDDDRRLLMVFEQGIEGMDAALVEQLREIPLQQLSGVVEGLDVALDRRLAFRDIAPDRVASLKESTTILGCTWEGLLGDTAECLGSVVELPPVALRRIGVSLRTLVADAVDTNAEVSFGLRRRLDRMDFVAEVSAAAELIDLDSLQSALVDGACSTIDKQPVDIGDAYYEGIATQPGHVAAGLVVPRPELASQVMAALAVSQAVVLAGPSGVGKSAALWTLPYALPGVLWFRVNRLGLDDVPQIMRLARAFGASPTSPVGLLVDAAGTGDLHGWSRLRQAAEAAPGVLLVGTARNEDLLSLGDLANCMTVRVALEADAAEAIHRGLVRRGATTAVHWKEAYEQSDGLTLEFTHLLAQGSRLRDVLASQVVQRVRAHRETELQILALVTAADRWSASLPVKALQSVVGGTQAEQREALARLDEEHLIVERNGQLAGVHQIRSRAISDIIHDAPPPTLAETATAVLGVLDESATARFIYEVLRERPDLEAPILATIEGLVRRDASRLVGCLRGLELLDFYRQAAAWLDIATRHEVPLANRPLVLQFATAGLEFPDLFPAEIRSAAAEMSALPDQSSTRDALLQTVGLDTIASQLGDATSVEAIVELLRAVRRTGIDTSSLLNSIEPSGALVTTLRSLDVSSMGDCIASARDVSVDLANALVEALGGVDEMCMRIRNSDPWIPELHVATVEGDDVGVARILHVSDDEQGDPRENAIRLGRLLLRLLPNTVRVDVKTVVAGGRALEIDGHAIGSSGLLRSYDHHTGSVRWNQDRLGLVRTLFGASDTDRLAEAATLLAELAELTLDLGNAFVQSRGSSPHTIALVDRCVALDARGRNLPPRIEADVALSEDSTGLTDPLSAIVVDVCDKVLLRLAKPDGYVALSTYINQTVIGKDVRGVCDQPWSLVGLDGPPPALNALADLLLDLDAVISELGADEDSNTKIVNVARAGSKARSLSRAADLSRRRTGRREQARRRAVTDEMRSSDSRTEVIWVDGDPVAGDFANFAVVVQLDSLDEWPDALDEIVPRVEELRVVGESPLLVPTVGDRCVPMCAKRLVSSLWPCVDLGEFAEMLPPPVELRLTTSAISAHKALQVWSALASLSEGELTHQVATFLEQTVSQYEESVSSVRSLGSDDLITGLVEWLEEVRGAIQAEWQDDHQAGGFAARVVEGTVGGGSAEGDQLEGMLLLSLQWDLDPDTALMLLQASDE